MPGVNRTRQEKLTFFAFGSFSGLETDLWRPGAAKASATAGIWRPHICEKRAEMGASGPSVVHGEKQSGTGSAEFHVDVLLPGAEHRG